MSKSMTLLLTKVKKQKLMSKNEEMIKQTEQKEKRFLTKERRHLRVNKKAKAMA